LAVYSNLERDIHDIYLALKSGKGKAEIEASGLAEFYLILWEIPDPELELNLIFVALL